MIDIGGIKVAMFDLDGTLIPFPKDFLFSQTFEVFSEMGIEAVSREAMESAFARFDFFSIVDEEIRNTFMERYWARFQWNAYPRFSPFEGAINCLASLKEQGITTAIVTSRAEPSADVAKNISETGLLEYIDRIETRSSVPGGGASDTDWSNKTPQISHICKSLKVEPKHCLMAGDVPPDIESAKKEEIGLTIGLLSGGISLEILKKADPDYILPSVASIVA